MEMQSTDIFTERVNKLMKTLSLSKKDMASRLNVDYSTFWRKLNGKRNVDISVLMQIAGILGTSVAYLIGETSNPIPPTKSSDDTSIVNEDLSTTEKTSKETIHQKTPGHLVFKHGDYCVDIPDTPSNRVWFRELTTNMMMNSVAV